MVRLLCVGSMRKRCWLNTINHNEANRLCCVYLIENATYYASGVKWVIVGRLIMVAKEQVALVKTMNYDYIEYIILIN